MFIDFIIDYPILSIAFISTIFVLIYMVSKLLDRAEEKRMKFFSTSTNLGQQQLSTRKQLAEKTRQYKSGDLPWQELIDSLFDANKQFPDDVLISNLYSLIEHLPKRGGFLGVSEEEWQRRQRKIENILNDFENPIF